MTTMSGFSEKLDATVFAVQRLQNILKDGDELYIDDGYSTEDNRQKTSMVSVYKPGELQPLNEIVAAALNWPTTPDNEFIYVPCNPHYAAEFLVDSLRKRTGLVLYCRPI